MAVRNFAFEDAANLCELRVRGISPLKLGLYGLQPAQQTG
jgi:uncharacterized protein YqfB (UPF0267 family)